MEEYVSCYFMKVKDIKEVLQERCKGVVSIGVSNDDYKEYIIYIDIYSLPTFSYRIPAYDPYCYTPTEYASAILDHYNEFIQSIFFN